MVIHRIIAYLLVLTLAVMSVTTTLCQQPGATPSSLPATESPKTQNPQETISVNIEEVRIPIAAYDSYGHLDPTLELNDLLLLENGVPQQLRSLRHVAASVLLLLDTGGEINSIKNIRATKEIAWNLVSALRSQDQISVMQFNTKVELLQNWTADRTKVKHALDTQLLSGKGAALSRAISASVDQFRSQPVGSRHLVLITDGADTAASKPAIEESVRRLLATNAVVHVISYTEISRASTNEAFRIVRNRNKATKRDDLTFSIPAPDEHGPGPSETFQIRQMDKPGGKTFDLDSARRRQIKQYRNAMTESELMLTSVSRETGGNIWLPESFDQMIADAERVARLIDAEYLATYRPGRPLASSPKDEVRRIEVVPRRVGLNIVSRRSYTVGSH